jgi:NAD(P)-dependent dehydrogenase (short-subunit alcohol dehydrogenase family)
MPTLKAVLDHPLAAGVARSRTAAWLVNPRTRVDESRLRRAVDGRTILITGASYGLGAATARLLAEAGATVLLVARTAEALKEVADAITGAGGTAHAYPADLSDKAEVEALAGLLLERHGHLDVIVHNAGKSIRRSLAESAGRFHDFERTIGVNYLGPVQLTLALLPSMRARGQGHLINISSIGARLPPGPRWAAYQASKTAFDVFFRCAAAEASADGVTATSIYMALIRTRMSAPTGIFDNVPGLSAEQAAELVARAIVHRPPKISPWWAGVAEATFAIGRRPWERIVAGLYRRGRDNGEKRTRS